MTPEELSRHLWQQFLQDLQSAPITDQCRDHVRNMIDHGAVLMALAGRLDRLSVGEAEHNLAEFADRLRAQAAGERIGENTFFSAAIQGLNLWPFLPPFWKQAILVQGLNIPGGFVDHPERLTTEELSRLQTGT